MSSVRARVRLVAAAVLLVLVTACTVVQEPDAAEWRDHARQTLDDVASEVATARVTLEQLDQGNLPTPYGETVLAEAEEAVSTSEEGLSSLQPPSGLRELTDRLLALIGRAADAVQQARQAVVDDKLHAPSLVRELDRLHAALDKRRASL